MKTKENGGEPTLLKKHFKLMRFMQYNINRFSKIQVTQWKKVRFSGKITYFLISRRKVWTEVGEENHP